MCKTSFMPFFFLDAKYLFVHSLTDRCIRVVESNKGVLTSLWGYFGICIYGNESRVACKIRRYAEVSWGSCHTTSINHQLVRHLMGQMQSISTLFVISHTHNTTVEPLYRSISHLEIISKYLLRSGHNQRALITNAFERITNKNCFLTKNECFPCQHQKDAWWSLKNSKQLSVCLNRLQRTRWCNES